MVKNQKLEHQWKGFKEDGMCKKKWQKQKKMKAKHGVNKCLNV